MVKIRPKLEIAVRSKKDPVTPTTNIYIADTIGELKQFIAGSEFVLMGGSFVQKGGHNILEVAQLGKAVIFGPDMRNFGKAVIFGPDMRNFKDESELFLQNKTGIQCKLNELTDTFNRLLKDTGYKQSFEKNAHQLIEANNDIVNNYHALIQQYFIN